MRLDRQFLEQKLRLLLLLETHFLLAVLLEHLQRFCRLADLVGTLQIGHVGLDIE